MKSNFAFMLYSLVFGILLSSTAWGQRGRTRSSNHNRNHGENRGHDIVPRGESNSTTRTRTHASGVNSTRSEMEGRTQQVNAELKRAQEEAYNQRRVESRSKLDAIVRELREQGAEVNIESFDTGFLPAGATKDLTAAQKVELNAALSTEGTISATIMIEAKTLVISVKKNGGETSAELINEFFTLAHEAAHEWTPEICALCQTNFQIMQGEMAKAVKEAENNGKSLEEIFGIAMVRSGLKRIAEENVREGEKAESCKFGSSFFM